MGFKIAYYRKLKNLTQEQLAEKMGTSTSYIGSIESCTYKPISLSTLFRIAKGLDVPASKFLAVLTDLYEQTKDIKVVQAAAGHTTSAMTLKHYVKGRKTATETAAAIDSIYAP